jgi:hypothetical protein
MKDIDPTPILAFITVLFMVCVIGVVFAIIKGIVLFFN